MELKNSLSKVIMITVNPCERCINFKVNNQHKINRWKHLANKNSKANFKIVYKPWFLTYGWPRLFFCNLGMITLYLGKKQSFSSLVVMCVYRKINRPRAALFQAWKKHRSRYILSQTHTPPVTNTPAFSTK